jgi:hypothetical protein
MDIYLTSSTQSYSLPVQKHFEAPTISLHSKSFVSLLLGCFNQGVHFGKVAYVQEEERSCIERAREEREASFPGSLELQEATVRNYNIECG